MAVGDCLTRCSTDIQTDIVTIGVEIFDDNFSAQSNKVDQGLLLFGSQGKKVRYVPVRHEEQVTLADRVPVPAGIAELVLCDYIVGKRLAERTLCWLFHD